ncbi:MAG: aminotransferase class IV [Bacteroidetes bacterium]|jgi:branched-chain amino acid aminotransferase|nr:aminotransferase class IV [Bacteroidota bacterium]
MVNLNGELVTDAALRIENRAFKYGDGIYDTVKVIAGEVQFLEAHYFRLMATMRILRMEIPMHFTLEFYEQELLKSIAKVNISKTNRVRASIYRTGEGLYTPKSNVISYVIESSVYTDVSLKTYEIDIFKDFYISSTFLSTLKTTNRIHNVLASIYADENKIQNGVLINEKKQLVEAANANLFIIKDAVVITPPLSEGCLNGIMRRKLIEFLQKTPEFELIEAPILLTDLLQCQEVFITNSLIGIQSVTKFKKKDYKTELTQSIKATFEALI